MRIHDAAHEISARKSGFIAFKTPTIADVFRYVSMLKDIGYCCMFGVENLTYVDTGSHKILVVEVDSESG